MYNRGGKLAPQFNNIEILRYSYLLYKHPYVGPHLLPQATHLTLPNLPTP